ncbi:class I SAM-dependent methyltransferase [Hyperthermus butylicus]|uniref:Methyltransferase type 11 domain-containing protein n=1 Tax=Hyperthermus butylicus (strain DSM 5456 / JCM 9403 / PLM1-5) TaxID=415426 RepID=A2BMB4_HYPBU|nr:class I SAM-dependent methyltransferase [Hyperthermus butylicus]ABM81125.1 hypothetical protein Hbut_1295 [Hyperthermus butylicus DSM 5456]
MASRKEMMRLKYNITCANYDELYGEEQREKYECTLRKTPGIKGIILDDGCGTALFVEFLKEKNMIKTIKSYICLDLTPCMLDKARERIERLNIGHIIDLVEADAEHIPLRSKSVDYTFSFTVIDLLEDIKQGVNEIDRVTRIRAYVSSLKKASNTMIKPAAKKYGLTLCETSKDIVFMRETKSSAG